MRIATIVIMLSFVVLFAASAVAQEVTIDAGANGGGSEGSNSPTIDLEAAMPSMEEQTQPSERTGTDLQRDVSLVRGQAGTTGARGARGQSGARGPAGPPTDPRVVAKMVLAELEKSQRGETPAGWAKPYLDALKAEKLVVGYTSDGKTIRPHEKATFQRVVTVVGRVQQQLREEIAAAEGRAKLYTDKQVGTERDQRISADAKKKEAKKKMEHIGVWVVAALLGVIVGYLIRGRDASGIRRSGDGSVNAANDPGHVRRTGEALGIPDFPRMAVGPVSELVMEWTDDETGEQRRYRRATTDPPTAVAGYPDARGAIPGGGSAVALAVSAASLESSAKPAPSPETKIIEKIVEVELPAPTSTEAAEPTPEPEEKGAVAKLARRVSRRKTKAEEAAIADAKPTETPAAEESAEKSAGAKAEEV